MRLVPSEPIFGGPPDQADSTSARLCACDSHVGGKCAAYAIEGILSSVGREIETRRVENDERLLRYRKQQVRSRITSCAQRRSVAVCHLALDQIGIKIDDCC